MRRSEARAAERGRLRARAPAVRGVRARAQEVRRRRRALGRVHPQGVGRGRARARRAPLRAVRLVPLLPRTWLTTGRRALQRHPSEPALYMLAAAHELGAGAGGVEAARTLLQRGVCMNGERAELWAELVRVELSLVEDLRRCWDAPGVTSGGEVMDVHDDARESVMRRAIVLVHGNMAGVTWVVVACFPRSCHRCATLATEAVLVVLSRLKGTPFTILQSRRTAAKRLGKGASGRTLTFAHARASLRSSGA
jgi:hypothetical protein